MIEALNLALIGALAIMAILCWHRGIPSVMPDGRSKAIELFLLGMVLGLYAVARLSSFLAAPEGFSFNAFGPHLGLLIYAVMRYWRLVRERPRYWGQAKGQ